ncbi:MAG: cation transporter [Candidatus Nanopelagicales bacterium]
MTARTTAGGRHRGRLAIALRIAAVVFVLELVGAWITGSLALLADAGHVFTDMFGVAAGLIATTMAQRPPSLRQTFGWQRLEE